MSELTFEQKHMEALEFIREEVKSAAPRLENLEKAHAALDAQEKANQALVKELSEKAAKAEEMESKFASLEAKLSEPSLGAQIEDEAKAELKAIDSFFKTGEAEKKYLRTDSNENGGYLAPSQYVQEIIKKITEISPIRSISRVIPTSSKELEIPRRDTLVSGGWVGEGASSSASNSSYGMEKIAVHKMMVYTDVSFEMLKDSPFNIESEISSDVAEDFAKLEGAAFVNGTGSSQPEGLMTVSGITEVNSGLASALSGDSLLAVQGKVPQGYDLSFAFNRDTLHSHIRTLKGTTNDAYLFQPSLNGATPNTVAGLPYVLAQDMPSVAASKYPIICGDFRKAYYIADNVSVEMIRDGVTQATSGKVRFVFYKRVGGQVVLKEALAKIKISA